MKAVLMNLFNNQRVKSAVYLAGIAFLSATYLGCGRGLNTESASKSSQFAEEMNDDFGVNKVYASGGEMRIFKEVKESGKQGDEDGVRYNVMLPKNLVNYEATWYYTISKFGNKSRNSGAIKIGSHGKESDPTALYDARFFYTGKGDLRVEAPHMTYKKCKDYTVHTDSPAIKAGQKYGAKGIMYKDPSGKAMVFEFWMDPQADNNWVKIISIVDDGKCGINPIGLDGEIPGPANKIVATLRLNGAFASAEKVSVREIAPGVEL